VNLKIQLMKKLFFSIFLLAGVYCFSQTTTKKYNSMTKRYEYFDSRGSMIGYEFYNSMTRQWEYYNAEQRQPYQYRDPAPVDLSATFKAQSTLQNRYDNNQQKAQATVDDIVYKIKALDISEDRKAQILNDFTNTVTSNMSTIYNGNVDWLYDAANTIIKNTNTVTRTEPTPKKYESGLREKRTK
jgi:hypothetical protein